MANQFSPILPKIKSLFVNEEKKKENTLLPKLKNLWVDAKDTLSVNKPTTPKLETYSRNDNPEMFTQYPELPKAKILRDTFAQRTQGLKSGVSKIRNIFSSEPEIETIDQQPNKSPEILATIPKKISQNKTASQAVSVFEPQDFNLASRILRQENNPLSSNFDTNIYSSNQNTDGTYDEGLFQHNSDQITDKSIPIEQRVYTGTQGDINKLFKENYGRNYDVFNPIDNAEATKLWIQNIKERIKNNWGIEPTDEMVMYFYHKGSRNFSLTMQNNLLNKLNNHPYIVNSLDILGD